MLLVVMLEGDCKVACRRCSVGLRHETHVISLHRFHEALSHAVTLRAAYRRRQRLQADFGSEGASLLGDVARAVIRQPLNLLGGLQVATKAMLTAASMTSRTMSPLWPPVVAAQLIASRSQQSNANVTRSGSPLSQRNSKPSEHQR